MKLTELYIIVWACDLSEEVYYSAEERSGRINTLENQGYEYGTDFWCRTEYK